MPRRAARSAHVALLAACLAGCAPYRYHVKPGTAPRCEDGVCFEVVAFEEFSDYLGAWLDAPAGARLRNAHVAFDRDPPCGGGVPVSWVRVGHTVYRAGPADVAGRNGIALGFPDATWWAHDNDWTESALDLDLDVEGKPLCLRVGLIGAARRPAGAP